jgi:DNA-binding NarL/FixJ family response regulator
MQIVITEDDPRYRAGLAALFECEPDHDLVDVFESPPPLLAAARAARERCDTPPWDLALMDIEMPGMDGVEATRALKMLFPDLPIVMLTVFEEPETILQAICAGADGYLLKKTSPAELLEQIGAIVAGGSPLTPGVARTVLDLLREGGTTRSAAPLSPAVNLAPRELAVLRHLARGLSYKQVAYAESISLDTVRTYVRRVYRKLQVHNVAEAVGHAIRSGLA